MKRIPTLIIVVAFEGMFRLWAVSPSIEAPPMIPPKEHDTQFLKTLTVEYEGKPL